MGMYNCPDCDDKGKKYDEISNRFSSLRYHSEEYDRLKGKGKFAKDHPESAKLMDELLAKKTEMLTKHAKHEMYEEPHDESKPHNDDAKASIPVL